MGPCASKSNKGKNKGNSSAPENNVGNEPMANKMPANQSSGNEQMRFDAGVFVHLKNESIHNYFKIGAKLGEGSFGEVSLVTHKTSGVVRAMKKIKKKAILKEEENTMISEVKIMKELDHPNIVKVFELYQDNNWYYLITEYLEGGELFDKIKEMNHFTEKMAAEYIKQVLSAVSHFHAKKIAHRDLKPENIMLASKSDSTQLKIIDFGTSRGYKPNIKMTEKIGSPYYVAPEVLKGSYNEKCDMWSIGVILYILLCGYPPFRGRSEPELLRKISTDEDWGEVSKGAKSLIEKMLTLDVNKRITAAEAMNDPWITTNAPTKPLAKKNLENLTNFVSEKNMKNAILTFICSQLLTSKEKEEFMETFRALDTDHDGKLSKEEIFKGLMNEYGDEVVAKQKTDDIFQKIDIDKSGFVDFTEFLVANVENSQSLSKKKLEQAFRMFDLDGNGYITKEELQNILGGTNVDEQSLKALIEECDNNGDGKINQDEFVSVIFKRFYH